MADIKISELSIGDWVEWKVYDKPYVIHITQITDTIIQGVHDGIEYGMLLKQISPIPLTPEILEKNGISKTYESDEYAVYKGEGFNVTYYYTELWEFERHRNRLMIRNVHQLQHALRLAGVEKEIEV
jgi:hypothetical protein